MSGEHDALYVRARRTLLDATEALSPHLDSIVLVGAQAVYFHTGAAEFAVAEHTTDADFSIQPKSLRDSPAIEVLLNDSGFTLQNDPGSWLSSDGIIVDIMVPESIAGPGRRGADLGAHGRRSARRALGLEGTLIDNSLERLHSLDPADHRTAQIKIAGPASLLVAKIHKLSERVQSNDRVIDKDALDVFRMLRSIPASTLGSGLAKLRASQDAAGVTKVAIDQLQLLFGNETGQGIELAIRASRNLIDRDELTFSSIALVEELTDSLSGT